MARGWPCAVAACAVATALAQPAAAPKSAAPVPAINDPAPAAVAPDEEKITVNFVNADIQSVIKTVGQHTGKNFILDPRVRAS